ncbi:MAG: hypothetical protein ACOYKZ_01655 [Chlamydiia bacterium]
MKTALNPTKNGLEEYLLELLGDDRPESRPSKYVQALSGIGIAGIRQFIFHLLDNQIPSEIVENSYFHPNKFFKLGICRLSNCAKLRLHFWNKNQLEATTPIHSHAWDFASMLISGSYRHDLFRVIDLVEDDHAKIDECLKSGNAPDHYLGMYRLAARDSSTGKYRPEWAKNVRVERIDRKIEQQGSIYFLGREFPHQIAIDLKSVGSMITLVLASETNRENLYTLQPIGKPKTFDNPSPNVDERTVRAQLEIILNEIDQLYPEVKDDWNSYKT